MQVYDKVRNLEDSDIMGIVLEMTETRSIKANPDMTTTTEVVVQKVKILTFPANVVVSSISDKWEIA